MNYKYIPGGITAPKGFSASGLHCGIRKNKSKKDLALIYCKTGCSAFAVYTQNLVKGAPITVTKQNLADNKASAVICNSGNANTCNADGIMIASKMCELVSAQLEILPSDVIIASTGVIGAPLPIEPIEKAIPKLVGSLAENGSEDAAEAIMTTDTVKKEFSVEFLIGGKSCRIGIIAKGSGMIEPNMATLLGFVTTDVCISDTLLEKSFKQAVSKSFNTVSIDGDTSTNDMVTVMSSKLAQNKEITSENDDYSTFCEALNGIMYECAKLIAKDGEGATKLIICDVTNAKSDETAFKAAKSVINSSLVKTAIFGEDANWGRILCAIGYCGCPIEIEKINVSISSENGDIEVCKNGEGVDFNESTAKYVLFCGEITININMNDGAGTARALGCDLTYDYVKINGDYRT